MKNIFIIIFCVVPKFGFSQVGINTTLPKATLDITATNSATPAPTDGVLVPRINVLPATNPTADQNGMLVFLTTSTVTHTAGLHYWDNGSTSWKPVSGADKDWLQEGTALPPQTITDNKYTLGNVVIGKNTISTDTKFEVENTDTNVALRLNSTHDVPASQSNKIGIYNTMSAEEFQIGLHNDLLNISDYKTGISNNFSGDMASSGSGISTTFTTTGTGNQLGVNNTFASTSSSGSSYGMKNLFQAGAGYTGSIYGISNEINVDAGSFTFSHYGLKNTFAGSGAQTKYGVSNNFTSNCNYELYGMYNSFAANSPYMKFGTYNDFSLAAGIGTNFGVYNNFDGSTSTSNKYGIYNYFGMSNSATFYGNYTYTVGSGNGTHYGNYNFLNSSGSGVHYGSYNKLSGTTLATGIHYGNYNLLDGAAVGTHYGSFVSLTGEGAGQHCGSYTTLDSTGSGLKYGGYYYISPLAGGTHYGIYSSVIKAGATNYAGYFQGNVYVSGTFSNPSDKTLKENIQNTPSILAKIKKIEVKDYNFKKELSDKYGFPRNQQSGFIAQDFETLFPNLVKDDVLHIPAQPEKEQTEPDRNIKTINYIGMIPVLTKAIQEQQQIMEKQQEEINLIKQQLEYYKKLELRILKLENK